MNKKKGFAKPPESNSTLKTAFLNCVTNPDGTWKVTLSDEIQKKLKLSDDLLENNRQLYELCLQLLELFSQSKSILIDYCMIKLDENNPETITSTNHLTITDRINSFISKKVSWKIILTKSNNLQLELGNLNEKNSIL